MLDRFRVFKIVVDEITSNPERIEGLQNKAKSKLRKLALCLNDWLMVDTLVKMLKPFKKVTDLLQGQKYETLSLSKAAEIILFQYFENIII